MARALATGGKLIILAESRRALAQAIRTPGAGRRHTALTHRRNPTGPASQPRRPRNEKRPVAWPPGPAAAATGWISQDEADQSDQA